MRNRKTDFKKTVKNVFSNFKFEILNLNLSRSLTVIGAIIGIVSLFMDWITDSVNGEKTSWNSFNAITGNSGYIIIILLILIIALTFGSNYKEKMKLYSEIDVKNYTFILFTGILMIVISIICTSFSVGLEIFSKEVKYGNGLILCTVSAILIIIGGYITRKEFYKNSSEIILEKLSQERRKEKKKSNLSLPF
ncbi:hypothetical protein BKN14_04910 [Candidatus Gracilibacteria bacterium HOT-871]|nr:hypothetical protein BKN14_04910 [Candidatus Gracilibacteria bacterium HOT-871]MBB1565076.1 hypothetical protein [Candidatus Gracilibacteria bacterium]MBF0913782.1 hypothetical protein [Candidatus Gracilibacteria bacterium]RKW23054.1 MAG: hypothetical protein D8B46_04035 [Candidatus Gracilibacteria bacterium]